MKKTILFAMFAAGMMASCSQDSNNVVQPLDGSQDGKYPIMLGVGSELIFSVGSKATGTVGGATTETNKWKGQPLFIYSFNKTDAELVTPIIENEGATAPANAASGAITWKNVNAQFFYEGTDKYDFYGYHVDDAVPVVTPATTPTQDPTSKAWGIDVKIDGTQDLLIAKAVLTKTDTTALKPIGFDYLDRAYSAFTARKGVQPNMSFKHLLARLTFSAYSGSAETSANVKIDSIEVMSIASGKVVFVAKTDAERTFVPTADAKPFYLNERDATGVMKPIPKDGTALGTYDPLQTTIFKQKPTEIGESMMVVPAATYKMVVYMKQDIKRQGETTSVWKYHKYPATIQGPTLGGVTGKSFDAGKTYNMKIGIRGLEKVDITAELTSWGDGGNTEFDPDAEVVTPPTPPTPAP